MSTEKTEKLALHRWVAEDLFLRTEFNENFTAIDQQFASVDDRLAAHVDQHGAGGTDPITPNMIGAASNPNLLDNWYFVDPVDQRQGYVVPPDTPYYSDTGLATQAGTVSSYTKAVKVNDTYGTVTVGGTTYYVARSAAVRGYVGGGVTVDRWNIYHTTPPLLVEDDAVHFIGSAGSNGGFQQIVENPAKYMGQTMTVSALVKGRGNLIVNNVAASSTNLFGRGFQSDDYVLVSGTFVWAPPYLDGVVNVLLWSNGSNPADFCVKAAKLELGDVQTLAHQDGDGNWVLNDPPPNKGLELLKCITSTADAGDAYANKTIATAPITGTYTGTGAARSVTVGGSGKVCLVWNGTHYAFVNENGFVYIWSSEGLSGGSGGVESAAKSITFVDGVLAFAASTVYPTGYTFMNQAGTTYNYQVL